MLLPPPGSHVTSTAAATMQKVQANAMKTLDPVAKAPAVVNNENNPNMANQAYYQTHEEPGYGLRRAMGNLQPTEFASNNQENNVPLADKLQDDKTAASRSISARMRTALAPRSTNTAPVTSAPSNHHHTEKFSVQATMTAHDKPKEAAKPLIESKVPSTLSSVPATKPTNAAKFSTTSSSSYRPQQPKFDIYIDHDDENVLAPPVPLTSRSTASHSSTVMQPNKSSSDIHDHSANKSQTESISRPVSSSSSSSHRYESRNGRGESLQKLARGFEDMKLGEAEASPEVTRSMAGQKRVDISTKDAPVYTPTDRNIRSSKRAKEAWSSQPMKSLVAEPQPLDAMPNMAMANTPPDNMIKSDSNKIGTLEAMHDMLDQSINVMERRKASNQITTMDAIAVEPSVKTWVVRYVDYSSKYGLGYLFNNGSAGVYFNDSTKIVLSADGRVFQYVERIKRESSFGSESSSQKYMIDSYPPELHKKVTLLKHFRNYLVDQVQNSNEKTIGMEDNIADTAAFRSAYTKDVVSSTATLGETMSLDDDTELAYVKKWVRTKHALLFRLNNRTVQVVFYDKRYECDSLTVNLMTNRSTYSDFFLCPCFVVKS